MRSADRGFHKETIKLSQIGTGSYFIIEELDFIINYDIKYRMGLSGEENEKKMYSMWKKVYS
jgi:hypothetical protein